MESINNSSTAYVQIVTSTLWAFHINFNAFSLIKTEFNGKYTSHGIHGIHQMHLLSKCMYMYVLYNHFIPPLK